MSIQRSLIQCTVAMWIMVAAPRPVLAVELSGDSPPAVAFLATEASY
jgi:hypothetical protein